MRVFAGAMMGVRFGLALTSPETPPQDLISLVDAGFDKLKSGIKLQR